MIRLAPLITANVDTTTLPGGKASDAAQDFLALLSEALAGETTTDKAAPQLLVATDKPTTKGEPLISDIVSDAQQADLLIPVDETLPVINDELKQEALKKFVTPGNLMCSSPYLQFFSLTRKYSRYE